MDVHHKTILITGGARVGQAVAKVLAEAGAHIAMTYFQSDAEISQSLKGLEDEHGIRTKGYKVNMTVEEEVRRLLKAVIADFGSIDGLVLMTSTFTPDETIDFANMEKIFAVNAFGNMLAAQLFAQAVKEAGATAAPIVAFIDWAVDHPYAGYDTYIAAKAALRHYLMALQVSFAGSIRVTNIHPGMILPPKGFSEAVKQTIVDNTPTQAIGTPEQAAQLTKTALELDYLVDNIYLAGGQQWRHRLS